MSQLRNPEEETSKVPYIIGGVVLVAAGVAGFLWSRRALASSAKQPVASQAYDCTLVILDDHANPDDHYMLFEQDQQALVRATGQPVLWQNVALRLGYGRGDDSQEFHDHEVLMTEADFAKLAAGEVVELQTTVDNGHSHRLEVHCLPA